MKNIINAIVANNISLVKEYLTYHDINAKDDKGNTYLHYSIIYGRLDITYFLIEHHIMLDVINENFMTPLFLAVHKNYLGVVKKLLESGANVNIVGPQGETAFLHACKYGREEIVALFVEQGKANFNICNDLGENAFFALAHANAIKVFSKYFKNDFLYVRDSRGNTLLHIAAKFNSLEIAKYLLRMHINPNLMNDYKEVPLFLAYENKHESMIKLLLEAGALTCFKTAKGEKLNLDSDYDRTKSYRVSYPLHYAVYTNNLELFKENLNKYNLEISDCSGFKVKDLVHLTKNKPMTKILVNYKE